MEPYPGPMVRTRSSRPLVRRCVAAAAFGAAALAGCGRGDFADRTAVVELGEARQTYEVASCGLDGQTLFLVARAPDGALLQAVVGLEPDLATGVPASSGASVDTDPQRDDTRLAAFGAEAWERRGQPGDPPGEVTSARLRGSRIQLTAQAVPVDAVDRAQPGAEPVALRVDARCDERADP